MYIIHIIIIFHTKEKEFHKLYNTHLCELMNGPKVLSLNKLENCPFAIQ